MKKKMLLEMDTETGRAQLSTGFEISSAMRSLLEILKANAKIRIYPEMSRGALEGAYQDKARLALEAGKFYKTRLAPHVEEWADVPAQDLARCVGLNAAAVATPNIRALEAGDYTDPNNQLGILNGTLVLQQALPLFAFDYPELAAMFTDFSAEAGDYEQESTSHIISVPAVQKYNGALDANGRPIGFQMVSPAISTDVPITLTDYIAVPIVIGQGTLGATQRDLFAEMAPAGIKAIAGYFVNMLVKLITPANFNAYAAVTTDNPQTVPVAYATYYGVTGID